MMNSSTATHAWEVFTLFTIPWGGGIPAGVVLAQKRGLAWPMMTVLYFFSDVALAFVFEPLMLGLSRASKRFEFMKRFKEGYKRAVQKTANYGVKMGPFSLIMISFGADPMTGRTAALAAGHGFVRGWALAIIGDMFFFLLLMASTLWLQGILGDGTLTTIIITVAMLVAPAVFRRIRERSERFRKGFLDRLSEQRHVRHSRAVITRGQHDLPSDSGIGKAPISNQVLQGLALSGQLGEKGVSESARD